MNNILALSGRKQSGKNTAFNFLLGIDLIKLSVVREQIEIRPDGKLAISDIFGGKDWAGIFDIDRNTNAMKSFREEYIYPFIRNYSFADVLKQEVCIKILGLSWEQCYGTDAQKMSETHLRWENMPGITTHKTPQDKVDSVVAGRLGEYYEKVLGGVVYHEPGPMTGREAMQYVGTEIFRKMYADVWADATLKRIKEYDSHLSVITDCRFPNEVEAVQKAGGKVIRLTRNPFPDDDHASETALDPENYDENNFDAIIDNQNMSISEQNEALHQVLYQWEWRQQINPAELASSE